VFLETRTNLFLAPHYRSSILIIEKFLSDFNNCKDGSTKGERIAVKRVVSIALCALVLCSLILMVNAGTAVASEAGYSISEAYTTSAVTVDGKWGSGEWSDAWIEFRVNISNARFAYKMDANTGAYLMSWLVEFHDTTNNAGDIWRICIDGSADGGSAPQADDVKIEIVGHSNLTVYAGTGTTWARLSTTAVTWKDSLATSTYDAVNHYVLEVQADKGALGAWGASPPPEGFCVQMYDAGNPSQGWGAWPPTSSDVPSRWGLIADYMGSIPEGLSSGVLVILSAVAVLVGSFLVRKRARLVNRPMASAH
jgi:hypothetical protein